MDSEEEKRIRIIRIQRKLQEDLPSDKRLKYLKYLSQVTISVDILKETSIGKTVNLMKKEKGVIGQIAEELISKWKGHAAAECSNITNKKNGITSRNQNGPITCEKSKIDTDSVRNSLSNTLPPDKQKQKPKSLMINGDVKVKEEPYSPDSPGLATTSNCPSGVKVKEEPCSPDSSIPPTKLKSSNDIKVKKESCSPDSPDPPTKLKSSNDIKVKKEPCSPDSPRSSTKLKSSGDERPKTKLKSSSTSTSSSSSIKKTFVENIKSEPPEDYNNDDSHEIPCGSMSSNDNNKLINTKKDKKDRTVNKIDIRSEEDPSTNEDISKKKGKSFEEMLMMPVLPSPKKKKKKKKPLELLKRDGPKLPSLPEIALPQIDTEPVYKPTRQLPSFFDENIKKKAMEAQPPPRSVSSADITSRKTKSVMYTGKKNFSGVVPTLYKMCMGILIDNVDALYETGGVPFLVLEPLLTKCSAAQLERLEYYNPHFIQDTDELWKKHCQMEFKGQKIDHDGVGAWRDMYKELQLEREERFRRLSTKISMNQTKKVPERSVKLAFVATAPKPSAQVLRVQKRKEKERDERRREKEEGDKQKEIRERMMKEQRESSAVAVPFTNVPRRDRCSGKRPPTSLSTCAANLHPEPKKQKQKEELGTDMSEYVMPPVPKKKKAKNPMMMKTLKLLKKQKGRLGAQIMRK